jgi:hypothetical protein
MQYLFRNFLLLFIPSLFVLSSCVSVPQETVTLSETIGNDLLELQRSHVAVVNLHFNDIREDINSFVDDVYAPFVIHFVLNNELKSFEKGDPSIYGTIKAAGETPGKTQSEAALKDMSDFLDAARSQIEAKRKELTDPINHQQALLLADINTSYSNVLYANASVTEYLRSVRKVKDAQKKALETIGLPNLDTKAIDNLVLLSDQVEKAVNKGKEIDVKSDDALNQINQLSEKIKETINNNQQ